MHNSCGERAQYRRFLCTTSAVSMLIRTRRIHLTKVDEIFKKCLRLFCF